MNSETLKNSLKSVAWIYSANAAFKARRVRQDYERTVAAYAGRSGAGAAESLILDRAGS